MRYDCLIVDDETALSQSACEYFNMFGLKTAWTPDEEKCLEFLRDNRPDLILLDINLGKSSGFELCKKLRGTLDTPILFISARTSDDDMILALNIGGDDYISKPYSLSVLLAKAKAMLKRIQKVTNDDIFSSGRLSVDMGKMCVTVDGEIVQLKSLEYKLLFYLIRNRGRVITKDELFREVWEDAITGDNTLNVHIRRLREKIEIDPGDPRIIKTVWGMGYIFEADAI